MVCYAASLRSMCTHFRCLLQISLEARPDYRGRTTLQGFVLSQSNERPAILFASA